MERLAGWLVAALLLSASLSAGAAELERAPAPPAPVVPLPAALPALPLAPGAGALVLPTASGATLSLGSVELPVLPLLSLSAQAQGKMAVVLLRGAALQPAAPAAAPATQALSFAAPRGSSLNGKAGAVIEQVLSEFSLKELQTMPEDGLRDVSRRLTAGQTLAPARARAHEEHEHGHEHALTDPAAARKALAVNGTTLLVEALGALATGSAALSAEAMHNAVDVGLMAALVVSPKLSRFGLDPKRTQAKISLLIAGAILATVVETTRAALRHLMSPGAPPSAAAIVIALAGLANAVASLVILRRGGRGDSFRTLVAHFFADAVGSIGVIASGLLTLRLGWAWADPVMGFLIAGLVVWIGVPLLIRSLKVLLNR